MSYKTPAEITKAMCATAKVKCSWSIPQLMLLGIMAGAYIGFGGFLNTVVTQDASKFIGAGFARFMGGSVFSVGLMLVIIAGAELFTGNCLMPVGILAGCVPMSGVLKNWFFVYLANFIGAIFFTVLIYKSGYLVGAVGANAIKISAAKINLSVGEMIIRGILCNWLVVLAVWMSSAADDIVGKMFAIYFPVMAFVASGFEHSIANMYFIAAGIFATGNPDVVALAGLDPELISTITWGGYWGNIIPVTIGNMIGAIVMVVFFYYGVFKSKLAD